MTDYPQRLAPRDLEILQRSAREIAALDVREKLYNDAGHIEGSTKLPRRLIEEHVADLVPWRGTQVVVIEDDETVARFASNDLIALGYERITVLKGGVQRWRTAGLPITAGHSVPNKAFGEWLIKHENIPTVLSEELSQRITVGRMSACCRAAHGRGPQPGGRSIVDAAATKTNPTRRSFTRSSAAMRCVLISTG